MRALPTSPEVSWHRGGKELAPPASREAFVAAAKHGAELIEVDVRCSADGWLLCVHDEAISGLGEITEVTYGTLSVMQQESLLTFERFLDDLDDADPQRTTGIHLDLKGAGYEVSAVDAVVARGRRLFVTTLIEDSVRRIRQERPDVEAYLTIGSSRAGLSRAQTWRLRRREIVPMRRIRSTGATGIAVHYALATPVLRWWCRRRGLAIVVWTVDRDEALATWLARDISVLVTNRPLAALGRRDWSRTHR